MEGEKQKDDDEKCSTNNKIALKTFNRRDILAEIWMILKLAPPLTITETAMAGILMVAVAFCGHLNDTTKMAGASLGLSTFILFGQMPASGMSLACITYFSQLFGAGKTKELGVYFQKALVIFMLMSLAIMPVFLFLEPILVAIHQDPSVSRLAGQYMLYAYPGVIMLFIYYVTSSLLISLGIIYPGTVISVVCCLFNIGSHYVTMNVLHMGIKGSAVSLVLTYTLLLGLTLLYGLCAGLFSKVWPEKPRRLDFIEDWWKLFKLVFFSFLIVMFEWYPFVLPTYIAGLLGKTELSVQTLVGQVEMLVLLITTGIRTMCSIRVGQNIGAKNPVGARTTFLTTALLCGICAFVVFFLLVLLRYHIPLVFTNIREVVHESAQILPVVGCAVLADMITNSFRYTLIGLGRQSVISGSSFVVFYLYIIPVGTTVMLKTEAGVMGLWIVVATGLLVQCLVLGAFVYRTKWEDEVNRLKSDSTESSEKSSLLIEDNQHAVPKTNINCNLLKRAIICTIILIICMCSLFIKFA